MLKRYYPHEYVESVFEIDYQKLFDKGYRGILFDIDNTLVPHGADSTPQVDALFSRIHEIGFKTLMLSNNGKARIERFLCNIDARYIDNADKPRTENYDKAVKMLGFRKDQIVCIGDQVFTDILGANRSGIDSILVEFIGAKTETKIGIRRNLEKIILKTYAIRKSYQNRIGDIRKKEV